MVDMTFVRFLSIFAVLACFAFSIRSVDAWSTVATQEVALDAMLDMPAFSPEGLEVLKGDSDGEARHRITALNREPRSSHHAANQVTSCVTPSLHTSLWEVGISSH
jgi:hypothetical protein